jgi:C_GCAxxG_C_C family probable redox protein
MKSKTENAIALFRGGMNCAQSIVIAFSEELDYDREMATRTSCGFGGGMGRLQETCGAVTGSFMVLGIYNCKKYSANRDRKEATYTAIRKFNREFLDIHGTMNCRSLLNIDLKTNEGQRILKENNLSEVVCEKCISDSINIVEGLIAFTP